VLVTPRDADDTPGGAGQDRRGRAAGNVPPAPATSVTPVTPVKPAAPVTAAPVAPATPVAPAAPAPPQPAPAGRGGRGGGDPDQPPVPPGFRRLTQPSGLTVEERNNEISIESAGSQRGRMSLEIQVPLRTNLELEAFNGPVVVEGVEGEIEIKTTNGSVTLTNVAGTVVATTMNGTVTAVLSRVTADKAMSFTSFNGSVDVTLPSSVRANLKLSSYQGDVYTNFDLQPRSTRAQSTSPAKPGAPVRVDINDAIYGSVNGGGPEIELRTYRGRILLRRGP
jgi:hypothetical protein